MNKDRSETPKRSSSRKKKKNDEGHQPRCGGMQDSEPFEIKKSEGIS
jgi:hypothetical protein